MLPGHEHEPAAVRKLRHRDQSMRFGIFWPYSRTQIPSAEVARLNPDVLDLRNHVRLAQAVESIGMDFALIADGYAPASEANSRIGFQDPSTNAIILAVPLMLATSRLGFLSTIHTRFVHPVVIARLGAHLDWVSGGRWGWNIVNGFRDHEARLFGFEGVDHDGGYDLADEAVGIIKALWSNPPGGIDHTGPQFTVRGRIRRPLPETLPLLVSAASSERGRIFAARHCDYLFSSAVTAARVADISRDLERESAAAGRSDVPQILILADVFVRDEPGRARAEFDALFASRDAEAQGAWAAQVSHQHGGRQEEIMQMVGTPAEVAEQIVALVRACPAAGLVFRFPLWAAEEALRLQAVFAELEKAGVWRPPATRQYAW